MPTSHIGQINEIMSLISAINPISILDIGTGFGKYGFLARENLELCDGREKYNDWTRRIDGIEAFEGYLTPVHKYVYNNVYIGDAKILLDKIDYKYDLILLIDVLEHFEYNDGLMLLDKCKEKAKSIIVSTPKYIGHQEDSFDNVYEVHRFQWKKKHLKKVSENFFVSNIASYITYYGKDASKLKRTLVKIKLKSRIINNYSFIVKMYLFLKNTLKLSRGLIKSL